MISANHSKADYAKHESAPPIIIGDNCWLGANHVILPGVTLVDNIIVAAGSIVINSFPSNLLNADMPENIKKT